MSSRRKGVLVILDGLGDRGIAEFAQRTPLEAADTPNMDRLISAGQGALVDPLFHCVPVGTHTGTGVLLGIPPTETITLARGPVEAAGIGLETDPDDLLIRGNFATLRADQGELQIIDRRAGRIDTDTAELAALLQNVDLGEGITATLSPATQHRAVLQLKGKNLSAKITDTDPGSSSPGQKIPLCTARVPGESPEKTARAINRFISIAHERLNNHPINQQRQAAGLMPANGIICRNPGMGYTPSTLIHHLGLKAGVIAGESTVIGLGHLLNYRVITSPEFTSSPNTNLQAKVAAAQSALSELDIVFLHIKGPDICAHDKAPNDKKALLEAIDDALGALVSDDLVIGITGDHSTDCNTGRHIGDPVPSLLFAPVSRRDNCRHFGEAECATGGMGRISATGFLCAMLDSMGVMNQFKDSDSAYFAP